MNDDKLTATHQRLLSLYDREVSRQNKSRAQRALDMDFYHSKQFSDKELQELKDRGQPALVYNDIKPSMLWILGTERRNRTDWNVNPRSADDVAAAEIKTKLLKWLDDTNNARWERSRAFADQVLSGEGWTEIYAENDEYGDVRLRLRHQHWRNILVDFQSRRPDMDDANHLFRTQVLSLDDVKGIFPKHNGNLDAEAQDPESLVREDQGAYNTENARSYDDSGSGGAGILNLDTMVYAGSEKAIRVMECWYRKTEKVQVIRGEGALDRVTYDSKNQQHVQAVTLGQYELREAIRRQMYLAIFTRQTMLWHGKSPYAHNRFPFVRRTVFQDDKTGEPYGLVRDLRDPQSDLNKRRNKALYLLSTRRIIMDKNSVDNINELVEEAARPDSIIQKKQGSQLEILENAQIASGHIDLANQNSAYIRQISGVTGENQGLPSNATSGIAIQARAEQGTVITTVPFDQHTAAHQLEGELMLSLIEQFLDEPMQIRITGEEGKQSFLDVNKSPESDITRTKSDFVVSEKDYRATIRMAMSEQMMQLTSTLAQISPQAALAGLEMALELADIPNHKQFLARFRKAAGMPDPSDPKAAETQEQMAATQAQMQQEQHQTQQQIQQLQIDEARAKVNEIAARTAKILADTEQAQANVVTGKVSALESSLNAADLVRSNPDLAAVADDLLENMDNILPSTKPAAPVGVQPMPAPAVPPQPAMPSQPEPAQSAPADQPVLTQSAQPDENVPVAVPPAQSE